MLGLERRRMRAYSLMMDDTPHISPDAPTHPELAPPGTPLHIAVAPGMLEREHVVVREPGESDERYQSRCELFAALLDYAKQQG